MGAILSAHPVRSATRMQRHADRVISTSGFMMKSRMSWVEKLWIHKIGGLPENGGAPQIAELGCGGLMT